jgi:hypothetical protein
VVVCEVRAVDWTLTCGGDRRGRPVK